MTDIPTRPTPRPPVPEPRPRSGAPRPTTPSGLVVLVGLVALAGVAGGWPLLVMIAAILVMVFLHELGHYLTAKWAGMKVTEFFLGFGPRIWSFRRGETEYGVKAIPAGAYVKIVGMHNLDEYDPADADRTYMSKPFARRLSVAVAGSTMHFVLALVAFFVAFAAVGLDSGTALLTEDDLEARQDVPWTVEEVVPGSAADDAGVRAGDRVVSVDGVGVSTFDEFSAEVADRPDQTVTVVLDRGGEELAVPVTIGRRDDDRSRGFFGVAPDFARVVERLGVVDATRETASSFATTVGITFDGLATILSPSGLADLGAAAFGDGRDAVVDAGGRSGAGGGDDDAPTATGLVGITDGGATLLRVGLWGDWLVLFAMINVFIGVFNLIPLLPLDGGHVAIAVYEKIRSMLRGGEPYHVDVVKLLPVTYAVVMVLVFLGVSLVVLDTRTLVGG